MKTKNLTPRNSAPVKRENVAKVSTDSLQMGMIAPTQIPVDTRSKIRIQINPGGNPFAGDDAE
jgi:prenylated cyclic peptide (anacyclamide/piricyclamide family)